MSVVVVPVYGVQPLTYSDNFNRPDETLLAATSVFDFTTNLSVVSNTARQTTAGSTYGVATVQHATGRPIDTSVTINDDNAGTRIFRMTALGNQDGTTTGAGSGWTLQYLAFAGSIALFHEGTNVFQTSVSFSAVTILRMTVSADGKTATPYYNGSPLTTYTAATPATNVHSGFAIRDDDGGSSADDYSLVLT